MFNTDLNGFTKWKEKEGRERREIYKMGKKKGRREREMFNTDLNGFTKWKKKEGKKRKGNV